MSHCVNCGKSLDLDSRFCAHCGNAVTGGAPTPPPVATPSQAPIQPPVVAQPPTAQPQASFVPPPQPPAPASPQGAASYVPPAPDVHYRGPVKGSNKSLVLGISVGVGAIVLVIMAALVFGMGGKDTRLIDAHEGCKDKDMVLALLYASLSEDGTSLFMDGAGEESLGVNYSYQACVLSAVDVPSAVVSRMDSTSALMGVQTANWDGISASWSYHPRNGFDVYLELE
jgi:hypothetical protein